MILCLQCCPLDAHYAMELVRLICDIEPERRADVEFAIAHRRDTPPELVAQMKLDAETKFAKCHIIAGRRYGVGWPSGPNDLWAETAMRAGMLQKQGRTQSDAILTFEADCIPLRADWINVLLGVWEGARKRGKECVGHAHGAPVDHINGNAIFRCDIQRRHQELAGAHYKAGWDAYHGHLLIGIGEDTDAIFQLYNIGEAFDRALVEGVRKNGYVPALLHGLKGIRPLRIARALLADGTLAARATPEPPGYRSYPQPEKRWTPQS